MDIVDTARCAIVVVLRVVPNIGEMPEHVGCGGRPGTEQRPGAPIRAAGPLSLPEGYRLNGSSSWASTTGRSSRAGVDISWYLAMALAVHSEVGSGTRTTSGP